MTSTQNLRLPDMRIETFNSLWLAFVILLGALGFGACILACVEYYQEDLVGISAGCYFFSGSDPDSLSGVSCNLSRCPNARVAEWEVYFPEHEIPFRVDLIVSDLVREDGPAQPIRDLVLAVEEGPEGSTEVELGLYAIRIRDGQMVNFSADQTFVDGNSIYPVIRLPDQSEPIVFPISRNDIQRFTEARQVEQRVGGW